MIDPGKYVGDGAFGSSHEGALVRDRFERKVMI